MEEKRRMEESVDAMGSTWTLVLYGRDERHMGAAIRAAFEELGRIERRLSIYRPDSEWSRINRLASTAPVEVSSETLDLLQQCQRYSEASEGAFDITVGPLMELWGFHGGPPRVPRPEDRAAALSRAGFGGIHLDPTSRTVRFGLPGMKIDPGGIGKGYAIDRVVVQLAGFGIRSALVAASRSSIFGLGTPPESERGWPVEIRDPVSPRRTLAEVFLCDTAISTSGTAEKRFWSGRRIYSHLMDPRTGEPAQGNQQASVIASRATDSEAWAKPCFIQSSEWTRTHLPEGMHAFVCEDAGAPTCTWIPCPPA
jgi:FAD:protein FMN transferase